jgi:hypothetical protein
MSTIHKVVSTKDLNTKCYFALSAYFDVKGTYLYKIIFLHTH